MQDTITATTIELPAQLLCKAFATVLPGRSKDKARPILTALHLRVRDKQLELTTTNSYLLHRLVLANGELDVEPLEALLDADWVEAFVKTKPASGSVTLTIAKSRAHIEHNANSTESETIEADYPDCDNLLALTERGENGPAKLNAKYLGQLAKAHQTWGGDYVPFMLTETRCGTGSPPSIFRTATNDGVLTSILAAIR